MSRAAEDDRSMFDVGDRLPTLEVGRVHLRELTDADVPALFAIFGDPEVMRYYGFAALEDRAAAAALLADVHDGFRERDLFQWGVEASGRLIGTCTLAHLDVANRRAELGFALERKSWGRGYMTEALGGVLEFAFDRLALHRVYADADPRNESSLRVLERLGFRREGVMREHYLVQGEPQDGVMLGLLRAEWERRKAD